MAKDKPEKIKGREATVEEAFYITLMREEQTKSPGKIEEMSRWLVSIVVVITGLFGAGKSLLGLAPSPGMKGLSILPFVFFSVSIIAAILVNFPFSYKFKRNVPESIRQSFVRITRVKWWFLLSASVMFCLGVFFFVLLFV